MELSRETFQELAQQIHRLCGLVVGPDKMYLVHHRLEPVIRQHGLAGFEHLLQRLRARDGSQLHDTIVEAITTQETSFFRDPGLFNALREQVLPERVALLRRAGGRRHRIRMWSAAASTGQEAYSLAMLVREFVAADGSQDLQAHPFTILASDISADALETAKAARYSRSEVARGLSEEQLRCHFEPCGDGWILSESVRRLVHFRRFNLLHSPATLGAFDLILCRNVLIYFDEPTRRRICGAFYEILHDGGWLALGAAESLYGMDDRLETVKVGRMMLYRKPQRAG
jgi:chemotaxis protein methyltransferase CheR